MLNPARVHLLLKESVPCSQNYLLQVTLSSTSDLVSRGGGLKEDRANQFQRSSDVQHHIQTTGSLLLLVGTGGAGVVRQQSKGPSSNAGSGPFLLPMECLALPRGQHNSLQIL